jgi:hypothetical protein
MKHAATKRTLALPLWAAALMIWMLSIAQADAATISAPTDFGIAQGQTGMVPISVTDAGAGIVGVDITLQYDSSVIEVFGTGASAIQQSGFDTDDWILEQNIVTVSGTTKELRISAAAASSSSALPTSGTSSLFTIQFQAAAANSPTSSALTLTLADLNEAAVTATSGSVKLEGVTGALTLTPNPVRPSESVLVTLTDADLNTSSGAAETVNVTLRSKDSGAVTKETQTVMLTETGLNTAVFTGGFSTTYGTTGIAGGKFEVEPTDDLEGEYTDGFDASGDAGTTVTDLIDVVAGVDGTVSTSPSSVSAGSNVTITVTDADQANQSGQVTVSVRRINASGITIIDTETYAVVFNGSGVGTVIASTSSAAGSAGNGTLNVQDGDQIIVSYDDPVGITGAPVAGVSSITATSGSFTVPSVVEVAQSIVVSLTDSDLGAGTRISGAASVSATARNTTTSETEVVTLTEDPAGSGTFTVSVATVYDDGTSPASGNGTLGVKPNDVVVIEYSDPLNSSGGASTITSSNITIDTGVTGTVVTAPPTVNAGGDVTVVVTDADLTGFGSIIVEVIVKRAGGIVEKETITLIEAPVNSGIFVAVVPSSGAPGSQGDSTLNVQPGDQIIVDYDDLIGGSGTPENNVLSITATNGAFNSVPASISVADVLSISLTDLDIAEDTRVNGSGILIVTVRNANSGETEDVTLTEDPAGSGTFTGSINTAFSGAGSSGNNNNGTLGVAVNDVVVIDYVDNLNASGGSSTITSSNISVVGGGDGTVSTASASINAGESVTVTVQDADLGNSGTVQVTVRSTRGESIALTLNATGTGNNFTGTIATAFTSGATTSGAPLDVKAGDSIVVDYVDLVTSGGSAITRTSTPAVDVLGGNTGVIVASSDIQSGDGLRIQVTDSDLNVSSTAAETATATVTNNTNGDVETITLTETGINTGIFRATPPATTGSGSATSGDGTIQVSAHDNLTVRYADVSDITGGPQDIDATVQGVLWGDTSDNNKLGALDASQILQRSITFITFNSYQEAVANVDASSGDNPFDSSNITAFDATKVLQYVVGIINTFPVQIGVPNPHPYKKIVDERLISFGQPQQQGARMSLPIVLDETRDVLSGQFKISYDPQAYRVLGVKNTANTADYLVATNAAEGELLIAMAGAQSHAAGEGAILRVELEVLGAGGESPRIEVASLNGGQIGATPVEGLRIIQPKSFNLSANWPNPFNPETSLRYALPEAAQVKLEVYDMLGQKVRTLVDGMQTVGQYTVQWDARNDLGHAVASGLYFYRIEAGNFAQTRKMTLLR